MGNDKLFKELEIGFRELFRIVIPGAYFLALAQVTAADSTFSKMTTKNTASGLMAAFFLGLIGYALRPHERWFPYFMYFEKQRQKLNDEIARITKISRTKDNVDIYKYFLEVDAADVSDRIHYFTSFYYMLIELSLLSGAGAYLAIASSLWHTTGEGSPSAASPGVLLVAVAALIQIGNLFPLTSVRKCTARMSLYVGVALGVSALLWLAFRAATRTGSVCDVLRAVGWTPVLLLIAAYLFWRLGDKHWKQIVEEQIVLVNARAVKLTQAAERDAPPAAASASVASP